METEAERDHGVDRLITFADAVLAIAITLLALPLVDLPRQYEDSLRPAAGPDLGTLLQLMAFPALGLAISFFVIARLWWAHHTIYRHVVRLSTSLVVLTIVWLFTMVVFSVATAITTSFPPTSPVIAIYIGTMVVGNVLLTAQAVHIWRHPDLTDGRNDDALARVVGSAETTAGFVVALVVGVVFPVVNYFALFVLALTGRLDKVIVRRIEARRE